MTTRSPIVAGPEIEVLDGYRPGTVPVFGGKYLSVTTFRPDGRPVSTPVWFVEENGRLLVDTEADSGKVRRILGDPRVMIAPCSARGRIHGTQTQAKAEILSDRSRRHVERLFARKYRLDLIFIKPFRALQSALRRHTRERRPVILAITPDEGH